MTTKISSLSAVLFGIIVALLLAPASLPAAAPPKGDDDAAIQKRLRERYPQVQKLKAAGTIGETDEGYVDFVGKKDPKVADLVDDENDDRKAAYKLISEKEGVEVEIVAKRAGKRNLERAKPGEHVKQGGKWTKKT